MATVEGLRSQAKLIRARMGRGQAARMWCFCMEAGEEFPPDVQARIDAEMRPNDRIYIREYYPKGLLGGERQGDWCWGYVHWHGGSAVIKKDGSLEKVKKQ